MPTLPETAANSTSWADQAPQPASALTLHHYKSGGLYYAVISDIHLGHNRNPASRIVENLFIAFPDNAETASLDIIFIAGDIFDNLMMFNDDDVFAVKRWVNHLLLLCKKYSIKLRILEGTPLHDRTQSKYFPMENDIHQIGADLKYIDVIDIEYMDDLGIHILYIPDEPPGGSGPALMTVKDLMRARGIEKVDIAVIHGLFRFQIEYVDASVTHDEEEYLNLVSGNIHVGHDHTEKEYKRIHVQGSFDRLGHGYESPKGHQRFRKLPDGSWEKRFIENTGAMRFVTLNCTGMSLEDTFAFVAEKIGDLPDFSHVRILAEANHPVFANMDVLLRTGPLLNWKKEAVRDKEKAIAPLAAETEQKYVPINITRENISGLLLERIASDGASGAIMDAAAEILEELFPWRTAKSSSTIPTAPMDAL